MTQPRPIVAAHGSYVQGRVTEVVWLPGDEPLPAPRGAVCQACKTDMPRWAVWSYAEDGGEFFLCSDNEACLARVTGKAAEPGTTSFVMAAVNLLSDRVAELERWRDLRVSLPVKEDAPLPYQVADAGDRSLVMGRIGEVGHTLARADARAVPMDNESVDLIVTSPPYWAQRSYTDGGGEHYTGQIGDEPTYEGFLDNLVACTRDWARVLKPSGSIWVNLGDKYSTSSINESRLGGAATAAKAARGAVPQVAGMLPKSLLGLPWRYALRVMDELGLILREEVIWSKPNGMPESVTDRCRRSHEQWFAFTKSGGIEPGADVLPLCPQCGRPPDARTSLIARLKEANGGVVPVDLSDHVRANESVEDKSTGGPDGERAGMAGETDVPLFVIGDIASGENGADLVVDGVGGVVDHDAEVRVPSGRTDQGDSALTVDDASEPGEFCDCVSHSPIVNGEPWLPQSVIAEVLQGVADGTIDPQAAADYMSGDMMRTHSTWFHFTRRPSYYSAVDRIRLEDRPGSKTLGSLPPSVWQIATAGLKVPDWLGVDHYAAFPMELPRRIILGFSPQDVCTVCGEGRRPVKTVVREGGRIRQKVDNRFLGKPKPEGMSPQSQDAIGAHTGYKTWHHIAGEVCACTPYTDHPGVRVGVEARSGDALVPGNTPRSLGAPAQGPWREYHFDEWQPGDTRPGVVLDPFGGTGTTALVAEMHGRHGVHLDLSADYLKIAEWRTNDPFQRASALQVPKPPVQLVGQLDMMDLLSE